MAEKEERILEFKIDQGQLLKEAAASRKAIEEIRSEVKELNKAYKEGSVDVEEYTKESVRLEGSLKREQENYRNLNKALNTNSGSLDAQRLKLSQLVRQRNQLDKTTAEGIKQFDLLTKEIKELNDEIGEHEKKAGDFRRDVGGYKDSIVDASKEINVAGTSVGGLGAKLASFANPATAAVAVVGTFVAILGRGRQVQELFAQATAGISGAVDLLTKDLSDLVFATREATKEQTLFQTAIDIAKFRLFGTELTRAAQEAARFEGILQKVRIANLTDARDSAILLRDAQILKQFADDEQNSLQARLAAVRERLVLEERRLELINIGTIQELAVVQAEISRIGRQNASIVLLEREAQLYTSIAATGQASVQLRTEVLAQQRTLNKALEAQLELERNIARAEEREESGGPDLRLKSLDDVIQLEVSTERKGAEDRLKIRERLNKDMAKLNKQQADREREQAEQARLFEAAQNQARVEGVAQVAGAISQIMEQGSEEQKAFALFAIGLDTASAISSLTAASEANPTNAVTFGGAGVAQFVAGLVRILSNIAAAKQYITSFAEGGFTGPGFGARDETGFKPAGIVHEYEYVAPKHVAFSPEGRPHIQALEKLRLRKYADGGPVIAASDTSDINQTLAFTNAMRSMPVPVVSVKEVTKVQRRIEVKETISRR